MLRKVRRHHFYASWFGRFSGSRRITAPCDLSSFLGNGLVLTGVTPKRITISSSKATLRKGRRLAALYIWRDDGFVIENQHRQL